MAAPPDNVELEAAKFLNKLIQEAKHEPKKLATKLYVILQHMRSSGKENSMPYQVISRAMETVISEHGLDIDTIKSSRGPLTSGTNTGDSSSAQFAGSSQTAAKEDGEEPGSGEQEVGVCKKTEKTGKSDHPDQSDPFGLVSRFNGSFFISKK